MINKNYNGTNGSEDESQPHNEQARRGSNKRGSKATQEDIVLSQTPDVSSNDGDSQTSTPSEKQNRSLIIERSTKNRPSRLVDVSDNDQSARDKYMVTQSLDKFPGMTNKPKKRKLRDGLSQP